MRGDYSPRFIFVMVMLLFAVLAAPVGALITTSTEATFDADGTSAGTGEEILVQITVRPGNAEVRDLTIALSERDALIDDASVSHTIYPTGAPVNIERNGHTFTCDRLAPGESIVLTFNAYPKTLSKEDLTVADVTYTYVQQGQSLPGDETIIADTSTSLWFQNLALQDENSLSWTVYLGGLALILAFVLVGYQYSQKGKMKSTADADRQKMRKLLKEVSEKLELIQDNPSVGDDLKRRIDRELQSGAPARAP